MYRLFFLLVLFVCPSAFAQLEWERREAEFRPSLSNTKFVAQFAFKNAETKSVTIRSIQSSCGCTTAYADKSIYQPGERGVITAVFEFGERTGFQEKTLLVQTDAPKESTTLLKLKVWIPEVVKIEPAVVWWRIGEEKKSKTMTVRITCDQAVYLQRLASSHEGMVAVLKTIQAGREYQIIVTPKQTTTPLSAILRVETDLPFDRVKAFQAWAVVKD